MTQPELGRKIAELRKGKNLTQEELVERCHVSVRTIQRIEAGEVTPRISTVKIILAALDEDIDTIIGQKQNTMTKSNWIMDLLVMRNDRQHRTEENKNILLAAAIGGIVFLILDLIKSGLDVAWLSDSFGDKETIIYVVVIASRFIAYVLFIKGFILLGHLFDNGLLRISAYMLLVAVLGLSCLDVYSLQYTTWEEITVPYGTSAVIFGALGIVFGVSLIKLQDGMGELSRIAGILEIVIGCLLVTVILFLVAFVIMIPAIILEIILLYRGYEYLEKSELASSTGG